VGLTGATLAAAVVVAGLAYKNHRDYHNDHSPTATDLERGEHLNLSADLLFGFSGLIGVATGLAFYLTQPEPKRKSLGNVIIHKKQRGSDATKSPPPPRAAHPQRRPKCRPPTNAPVNSDSVRFRPSPESNAR
jgi:hypothetical protein